MTKWLIPLSLAVLLSACSFHQEQQPEETVSEKQPLSIEEPSEEELVELLKEEAKPAVFSELNAKQPPVNQKVKLSGDVTAVKQPGMMGTFSLQTNDGTYTITNITKTDIKVGRTVTVYGVVAVTKAEDGTPAINAMAVEYP